MFLTKPKEYTVEEIHEAFDTSGEATLAEAKSILANASNEEEAKLAKELGFIQSAQVREAKKLIPTRELAEKLTYYIEKYPQQKFLTIKELERICAKYGLVYAPISAYQKRPPFKNLLEMKNAQPLSNLDKASDLKLIRIREFSKEASFMTKWKLYNQWIELPHATEFYNFNQGTMRSILQDKFGITATGRIYQDIETKEISRQGRWIAAPKSHFDLTGLDSNGVFGFESVVKTNIVDKDRRPSDDPIVFEYVDGGLIRVITKWGKEGEDEVFQ